MIDKDGMKIVEIGDVFMNVRGDLNKILEIIDCHVIDAKDRPVHLSDIDWSNDLDCFVEAY